MSRIMVDTCIYSNAMRGDDQASDILRLADAILLCPIVLGELHAGFLRGQHADQNEATLNEFMKSPRVKVIVISPDTSIFFAKILTDMRRLECPIPSNDLWIAACAMENGALVATHDKHFASIPGLLTTPATR